MLLRISLSESASLSRGANRDRRAAAARLCGLFSFDHAVMEAALAHVVRNKAEATYARSDLFEKRRALMEPWSEYLAA